MGAIARDFDFLVSGVFAVLAAVLLVIIYGALARGMRTFLRLICGHVVPPWHRYAGKNRSIPRTWVFFTVCFPTLRRACAILDCVLFENVSDNLRESFRIVAGSRAQGEIRELQGVSIASAGVTFQMFNAAFLSGPVATEPEFMQRILLPSVHFNARGLEGAYWVCEDWLAGRVG